MEKYREYLEDVYVEVKEDEINNFDFAPYMDMLKDEEPDMVNVMKAHIIVKHKLEQAGIQTSGGTVDKVQENILEHDAKWIVDDVKKARLYGGQEEDFVMGLMSVVATERILNIAFDYISKMDIDEDTANRLVYYAEKYAEITHEYRCNYYKINDSRN